MLCCSAGCARYKECGRAIINSSDRSDQVEDLYSYGSCSISWKDGKIVTTEDYLCGPKKNYPMFTPIIEKSNMCNISNNTQQISLFEIYDKMTKEEEKKKQENEKMNDSLDVTVKICDYNEYKDNKFPKVTIKSVFTDDNLVTIEGENGLSVTVAASEITKAVARCSHNRW